MSSLGLPGFIRDRLNDDERIAQAVIDRVNERFALPGWVDPDGSHWDAAGLRVDLFSYDGAEPTQADHIARHDPSRVLAFVAAGRALLAVHRVPDTSLGDAEHWARIAPNGCVGCGWGGPCDDLDVESRDRCPSLRAFALTWAGHGAYRTEWAPESPVSAGG